MAGAEYHPRPRDLEPCPCNRERSYLECCRPFHKNRKTPATAEELMRSRYSAYFFRLVDYLVATTHPDKREKNLARELARTIDQPRWQGLTILGGSKGGPADKTGKVEFVASYRIDGEEGELHEHSRFRRYKGKWMYLDGKG
ncbi:YchJ family protein [Roseibacillus ishigakijimensis]|uniref:UPF0225 protein JIN78_02995 n=1 Tax=Roseibacillus ishigakijimensis TaxID=454146 RepID=A0A934RJU9_9BACT|nr:YchJ family metal-binding protein [Roseibacillus ishigakijimensis]MBK1833017.1 SecC motif-containing protein [Roseibacillus ishigakijimensis]